MNMIKTTVALGALFSASMMFAQAPDADQVVHHQCAASGANTAAQLSPQFRPQRTSSASEQEAWVQQRSDDPNRVGRNHAHPYRPPAGDASPAHRYLAEHEGSPQQGTSHRARLEQQDRSCTERHTEATVRADDCLSHFAPSQPPGSTPGIKP